MKTSSAFILLMLSWLLLIVTCSLTLTTSPIIWQDEVQIVEYGRTSLPGADRDWGINWLSSDIPNPTLTFLGPLIQETAYLFGGISAVRGAAMAGVIFASFTLFGWLVSRGLNPTLALAGSLILLFDPMISQSYRGARVDALAMGFMFLSFWLVHSEPIVRKQKASLVAPSLVGAGIAVGCAVLAWFSAILLLPLLIYEVFSSSWAETKSRRAIFKQGVSSLIIIGVSAVLTASILSVWMFGAETFGVLTHLMDAVARQATTNEANATSLVMDTRLFLSTFLYSPWLPIGGTIALVLSGRLWLSSAVIVVAIVVIMTQPYVHRAIYLVPYMILAVVLLGQQTPEIFTRQRSQLFAAGSIGFLVIWGAAIGLSARTWTSLQQTDVRDPQLVTELARSAVGEGSHRVYVSPWLFYYTGRELGWKMYRWFEKPADSEWMELASSMDFLIFELKELTDEQKAFLSQAGFQSVVLTPCEYSADVTACRGKSGSGYSREFIIYRR